MSAVSAYISAPHLPEPHSAFTYTQETSDRYATPLPSPFYQPTPFAPAFSKVSKLLPEKVTYTTYSLNPEATTLEDGRYGQSEYAALWVNITYSSPPPFTTTVAPTPVATSELVYPPDIFRSQYSEPRSRLPVDFIWGVAGSAFQIEGGLQLEGRGPSALDALGALPEPAGLNDSNTAGMNYFLYKQDILRLAAIGVPYYSFSTSWSRIVPFGLANTPINTQALDHYEDLINTCLENGITPIVTLNHIDNPASVEFDDPSLSEHFLYYAKEVMTRYADRIPYWITFNEANAGIGYSYHTYNGMTYILLAHAAVYDWYKKELGGTGKITMKFANNLAIPLDLTKSEDVAATFRYQNFLLGIMGNPLFLGEQYPVDVLATPGLNLTKLTDKQIATIHGRADVYAFDPYVAQFAASPPTSVAGCASNSSDPLWPRCAVLGNTQANGWLMGQPSSDYAYIAPQYVRQQLGYVWRTFRPSGILIAEFGFNPFAENQKDLDGQRYDLERSLYHHKFLHEMLKAIHEDCINVVGAFVWSFLDKNEAGSYKKQYGMQSVNRTDGHLTRHYKRSFFDFVDFFHQHVI